MFDSGIGGLSVVNAIKKEFPECKVLFKNDSKNVPYGTKQPKQLLKLVVPSFNELIDGGAEVIVVACNTVTTTIISELRHMFSIPLVGMEPMIKPATQLSKSKKLAVFATPTTLGSRRYQDLKKAYATGQTVFEPDCSDWSFMIESNTLDKQRIVAITQQVCEQGVDTIVLGCTHYHWIENLIRTSARGKARVLQPEQPVIAQLKRVLQRLA